MPDLFEPLAPGERMDRARTIQRMKALASFTTFFRSQSAQNGELASVAGWDTMKEHLEDTITDLEEDMH